MNGLRPASTARAHPYGGVKVTKYFAQRQRPQIGHNKNPNISVVGQWTLPISDKSAAIADGRW